VLDFTSALYLGMRHPWHELAPWPQLTQGAPAALREPPGSEELAGALAAATGCERVALGTSTLHLFWDLFGSPLLRGRPVVVEGGTYPIARWGAERAAAAGARIVAFRHHDADDLARVLGPSGVRLRYPVVLCDGLCPACGRPAPLSAYAAVARAREGTLVVDDTQALGILGRRDGTNHPWGSGGGGTLKWTGLDPQHVLVVSSLAKGFGAPVAMLGGCAENVRAFENDSATRVHCSPPSAAALSAARAALAANAAHGDALRRRLSILIARFRRGVAASGPGVAGAPLPVQSLNPEPGVSAVTLHGELLRRGVRAIVDRNHHDRRATLSFLITARHRPDDIDRAVESLQSARRARRLA
jgi:8-amino-7-oxononanoate synthase